MASGTPSPASRDRSAFRSATAKARVVDPLAPLPEALGKEGLAPGGADHSIRWGPMAASRRLHRSAPSRRSP
jgi:hypothetical protein